MLFVHGINVGAWVWGERFLDYFAEAGFDAYAMSLRGHGRSWGAERIRDWGLADYVADLVEASGRIDGPVVLVGHSLGGAIVQKFIRGGGQAAGMALMASVPPWGLAPSAIRMAARSPGMFAVLLEMSSGRRPPDDKALLRRMLFSPETVDDELDQFLSRVGPESPRLGSELQGWPPLAPAPWLAPQVFVLGGADDLVIPCDEVWRTGLYYGCPPQLVPGLGHMVMSGPRWMEPAVRLRTWLVSTYGP
ncbi:alpha/beta hydrolase [Methylorubrum extorquens]|uniref:alpha/beta hydrolase n=1 Tax=Methylorubrum extorquens TaxID=408 RepID=UPI003F5D9AAE